MNIVFSTEALQHQFLRSWYNTLKAIGENAKAWQRNQSAFDMIDLEKPDMVVLTNANIKREILLALNQIDTDIKVVLYSTTLPESMVAACNPSLMIVPPDMPTHVAKNINHPNILVAQTSADLIEYSDGYYMDKAASDILVLVDRTTASNVQYLQQINGILALQPNLSVKCIGYRINTPLYVGQTSNIEVSCFLQSAKMVICYAAEMIPNCIINRAFCVTPYTQTFVPQFTNNDGLQASIDQFLSEYRQRRSLTKKARKKLLVNDTCFHRLVEIGEALGLSDWADKAKNTLPRYIT